MKKEDFEVEEDIVFKSALFGGFDIVQTINFLGKRVELWLLSSEEMEDIYKVTTNEASDLILRTMRVSNKVICKAVSSIDGAPFGGSTNLEIRNMPKNQRVKIYEERERLLGIESLEVIDMLMKEYLSFRDFYLLILHEKVKKMEGGIQDETPPFSMNGNSLQNLMV